MESELDSAVSMRPVSQTLWSQSLTQRSVNETSESDIVESVQSSVLYITFGNV